MKMKKKSVRLCKYGMILAVSMLICGAGMYGLAKKKQVTYYSAERSMVISHNLQDEKNNENYPLDQQMMITYKKVADNPIVSQEAHKYLPSKLRKNYSSEDIENMVSSKASPQSLVLTMQAKSSDKMVAVKTVNAMSEAMKKKLPSIQPGAGQVRLLAPANNKSVDRVSTPHIRKYVEVGLVIGVLIGLIICFVKETWDRLL